MEDELGMLVEECVGEVTEGGVTRRLPAGDSVRGEVIVAIRDSQAIQVHIMVFVSRSL